MAKQVQTQVTAEQVAKAEAAKAKRAAAAKAKREAAKQQETKTPISQTFYCPSNPPTAGKYLFAFTHAAAQVVLALPKKKQARAALWFHGSRAMRYHGADGTKKMLPQEDGAMKYDMAYFQCTPQSMDEKRRAVPPAWVNAFVQFFKTGDFPKTVGEGFAFKVSGKRSVEVTNA